MPTCPKLESVEVGAVGSSLPLSWVVPHLCGISARLRRKCLVMAMRAFFDESGLNPHQNKVLVMGGYLGTVEEWEKVSDAWDECLRASPRIEYFKSDEANGLRGEFLHFNRATAEQKKNDLAAVIGASGLQGFCASVRHDILVHRDPSATKRTAGSRTYDWGFFTATSGVLQHLRDHHPSEIVDFIFDERRELKQCISMFYELKDFAGDDTPWSDIFGRAGTCTPGDDKKIAALQMGDLLASEFSNMGNTGSSPTEAWKLLATHRGIAHVHGDIPWAIPILVALQGKMKQVKDTAGKFLKRLYKDQEKSAELADLGDDLIIDEALCEAAINALMEIHESEEWFKRFKEILSKRTSGEDPGE